jgi:DMSO/TMAO reductase YedYZ heme-binding membrane subunit
LVYIAAIASVIHFYWLMKADIRQPVQYGTILALLLGYRLVVIGAQRSQRFQKFQLFHPFQSWLKKPPTASRSSTFRSTLEP